jgi:hypothetical protein
MREPLCSIEHIRHHKSNTQQKAKRMKRLLVPIMIAVSAMTLLTGCLGLQLGPDTITKTQAPTVGQQLVDLQKAKDAGAITDAEYQAQKAKLLCNR